jgi:hypothetical protein
MGADHAINYKTQDWSAEIWRLTGKKGVNVVLDMVGGDYVAKNLRSLAPDGRLSQIAFLSSSTVELDMRQIMMKRLIVTGSTLRGSPRRAGGAREGAARESVPLFGQGKLKVVLAQTFPLAEAAKAHALMESGTLIGKSGSESSRCTRRAGASPSEPSVSRAAARKYRTPHPSEAAILAGEPRDQRGDLLGLAEPAHRDLRQHEIDVLRRHLVEHARAHRRRRHAVDAPRRCPQAPCRERLGEPITAAFDAL